MNYICAYWLSPDASRSRVNELKKYFDLQRYLKTRIGAKQIIVTNIDYPGAIRMKLPSDFNSKHALFTRYFAVKQVLESGLQFPICVHDHDSFNATTLPVDDNAILVGSTSKSYFSEQIAVYPQCAKEALFAFTKAIWNLELEGFTQSGYGTEVRHEGSYSIESAMARLDYNPFDGIEVRATIRVKDQVSFDILEKHSLDQAEIDAEHIPSDIDVVHGHLNKGPATEKLLNWLALKMGD